MVLANKKSVTDELLKQRAAADAEVVPGQWHASFKKTKAFAEANNIPFVAVWTNGDMCGFCVTLEKCFLDQSFVDFMKKSGYAYWLGTSKDTGSDVISGKAWTRDNDRLKTYPFMRAKWNTADKAMSGNDWDDRKTGAEGAARVIKRLELLFKDFAPAKTTEVPPAEEMAAPAAEQKPATSSPAAEEPSAPAQEEQPTKRLKVHFNPEWTKAQIKEFQKNIKTNGGYCPCQEEKTDETKCMCKVFRDLKDVPAEGVCCGCGLYQKYWA